MTAPKNELLCAIELAVSGDWEKAHEIVQQYETDINASWIHAVLHKIEGDIANARYWYHRADQLSHIEDGYLEELAYIRDQLTS